MISLKGTRRWLSNKKTYLNLAGKKIQSINLNHRHLFHTWATLTNKTRYLTRDRTPLASMACPSFILYLPLYWVHGIFFLLTIYSQQLTGGLNAFLIFFIFCLTDHSRRLSWKKVLQSFHSRKKNMKNTCTRIRTHSFIIIVINILTL